MIWRAVALGVVTGMRSQLPTALLAWRRSRGQLPEDPVSPGRIVGQRGAAGLTALFAAGELIGDKLAVTPSRLDAGPFLGRLTFGAAAGGAIASAMGTSRLLGGALGAAGAAVGTVLGVRYRERAASRTDVPDVVWALFEDAAALVLGVAATRVTPSASDGVPPIG